MFWCTQCESEKLEAKQRKNAVIRHENTPRQPVQVSPGSLHTSYTVALEQVSSYGYNVHLTVVTLT